MEPEGPPQDSRHLLGPRGPRPTPPAAPGWLIAGVVIAALIVATLAGVGLARRGAFKQIASHVLASAPSPKASPVTHPSPGSGPVMPTGGGSSTGTAPTPTPTPAPAPAPPAGTNPAPGSPTPAPATFDVTAGPGATGGSFTLSGNWTRSTSDGGNPGSTTFWTEQSSAQATWMLTGSGHSGPFSVSIYIPDRFAGAQAHYRVSGAGGTFDVTLDQEELTGWYRIQHSFTATPNSPVSVTLTYGGPSSHPGDPNCPGGSCTELAVNQVRFESA